MKINLKLFTIGRLRKIEDRVLNRKAISPANEALLGRLAEVRQDLVMRKVEQIKGNTLWAEVRRVQLLRETLAPTDLEARIDGLRTRAGWESSPLVKRIENMAFAERYPIVLELEPRGLHSTFASRLLALARVIRAQETLEPLQRLTVRQQQEILRFCGPSPSPEGVAHAIKCYVDDLRQEAAKARSDPAILQSVEARMGINDV